MRSHAFIAHGVPAKATKEEFKADIESQFGQVEFINLIPTRKYGADFRSIKVVMSDQGSRERILSNERIRILGLLVHVERWNERLNSIQCNRCYEWGHFKAVCKKAMLCGKCGGEHSTDSCTSSSKKCCNCGAAEYSWHRDCTKRPNSLHSSQLSNAPIIINPIVIVDLEEGEIREASN